MHLRATGSGVIFICLLLLLSCADNSSNEVSSTGQGGSMARFAIQGNYLYVASSATLGVYNINKGNFLHVRNVNVGFGLETIFAKGDYLYVGAMDAMYIYSISNPAQPEFIFRYAHIRACDPVVVQGNRAYVTLRTGGACLGNVNQLDVLDITDKNNPVRLVTFPMTQPGGLGIYGDCLFVCEGPHGLKLLNVANPLQIQVVNEIPNMHAYDVIVEAGYFTLTGADGVFQYAWDCTSRTMTQISKIAVAREVQ
jgi:hypothetical protein